MPAVHVEFLLWRYKKVSVTNAQAYYLVDMCFIKDWINPTRYESAPHIGMQIAFLALS